MSGGTRRYYAGPAPVDPLVRYRAERDVLRSRLAAFAELVDGLARTGDTTVPIPAARALLGLADPSAAPA